MIKIRQPEGSRCDVVGRQAKGWGYCMRGSYGFFFPLKPGFISKMKNLAVNITNGCQTPKTLAGQMFEDMDSSIWPADVEWDSTTSGRGLGMT